MTIRSKATALGLAAAMVVGGALPAFAVSAYATSPLNVRSCAGTDCRVVDVLQRGEEVDVRFCEGVWCAIDRRGADGWVNANYLARAGGGYDRDYDDDDYYDRGYYDDFYIEPRRVYPRRFIRRHDAGISACIGGPRARFCVYD